MSIFRSIARNLYRDDRNGLQAFPEICQRYGIVQDYLSPPKPVSAEHFEVLNDWLEVQGWPRLYHGASEVHIMRDTARDEVRQDEQWRSDRQQELLQGYRSAGCFPVSLRNDMYYYYPNGRKNMVGLARWPRSPRPCLRKYGSVVPMFTHINSMRTAFGYSPLILPRFIVVLRQLGCVVLEDPNTLPFMDTQEVLESVREHTRQAAPIFRCVHRNWILRRTGGLTITRVRALLQRELGFDPPGLLERLAMMNVDLPAYCSLSMVYSALLTLVEMGILRKPEGLFKNGHIDEDASWDTVDDIMRQPSWSTLLPSYREEEDDDDDEALTGHPPGANSPVEDTP